MGTEGDAGAMRATSDYDGITLHEWAVGRGAGATHPSAEPPRLREGLLRLHLTTLAP